VPPIDVDEVKKRIVGSLQSWARRTAMSGRSFHERSLSSPSFEIGQITMEWRFRPNWSLLKLGRAQNAVDLTIGELNPDIDYVDAIRNYYGKAQARRTMQSWMGLVNLPVVIGDLVAFSAPRHREGALAIEMSRSAGERFAIFFAAILRVVTVVAAGCLLLAFVYQQDGGMVSGLFGEHSALLQLLEAVPKLSLPLWLLILFVAFYLVARAHHLARKVLRRPVWQPTHRR
jgi:ubiquinone biosynthesis protein